MKHIITMSMVLVLGIPFFPGEPGAGYGVIVSDHARHHIGAIACHATNHSDNLPFECHHHED